MMTLQTLLFTSAYLFLLLPHFFHISLSSCTPSSCGIITNISYPFRLKHDPKRCGYRGFELACENNVSSLSLFSHKHYVKEINYINSTIRVVDASINKDDTCSFPNFSLYGYMLPSYDNKPVYLKNLPHYYPYFTKTSKEDLAWPVNFVSCSNPLETSSLFTEITHCQTSRSNSSHPGFSYVKVGHMNASEVPGSCEVELIALASWEFRDLKNVSLSEIHNSLLFGFQLGYCAGCNYVPNWAIFVLSNWFPFAVVLLAIVGLVCAVVSPPLLTIMGFTAVALLIYILTGMMFYLYNILFSKNTLNNYAFSPMLIEAVIAFMILAARFIVFPIALWFLIYKYRRRHMSMYNAIESFLQSDNKLMPIRYSYSDIKKMTRGFQDKLGEGGYGSVYKGKLRSGHDIAVKLLGKSGTDGKDFMNEIATIGRVHHVNIVQLVGYCFQGSKRALIFDFMPNGSLEKYLFNRDKDKSLKLDTRFEIAVGIARGIEYLHRGCDIQILHFDIKPHNILLDDKFIPKISDFGLAKFCSTNKTAVSMTAARGTIGYVAPELISRSIGVVSFKADVYSFGMMLMEIVSLKRDLKVTSGESKQYFPYWIYDRLDQGKDLEIETINEYDDNGRIKSLALKMTIVALWCIQMNPNDRPSMNKVLEMLEHDVENLRVPNHPYESAHTGLNDDNIEVGSEISTDSIPLIVHADGSSCPEITIE